MTMCGMPSELLAVLKGYDGTPGPFREGESTDAIGRLLKEHSDRIDELKPKVAPDMMAFHFASGETDVPSRWGTYFRPTFTAEATDGELIEVPSIKDVTVDILECWELRCDQFQNPIMRARYADLVWDLSKPSVGKKADVRFARIAIDSYVQIAKEKRCECVHECARRLERAMSIALSINDPTRLELVKNSLLALVQSFADHGKLAAWTHAYDLMARGRKGLFSSDQEHQIIGGLERCLSTFSDRTGNPEAYDPWQGKGIALRLAEYYWRKSRSSDAQRVVAAWGKAFEGLCEQAMPLLAMGWYEWVYSAYLQYGLRDEAERVLRLQKEKGLQAKDDMGQIRVKQEISKKEIEEALEDLLKGNLGEALAGVAICFLPRSQEEGKSLRGLAKEHPLLGRLSISVVSEGQVVARAGSVEEDFDKRLIKHLSDTTAHAALYLAICLDKTVEHYQATAGQVLDLLYRSPLYDPDRRLLLGKGIEAYLSGDYPIAIHVLVPQIEHMLRRYLGMIGGTVNRRDRHGNYQEKTLNDILWEPALRQGMGDDLTLYLRMLLADQLGWNVRNRLAHGLMGMDELTKPVADRVFHVLLLLGLFRPGKECDPNGLAMAK